MIFAADDWWMTAAVTAGAAGLVAIVGAAVTLIMLARDVRTFVLPHFLPPDPGEEDRSLPAQVAKIKADIAPTNGDRSSISDRVDKARKISQAVHAELEAYKSDQADERESRQDALDQKLNAIEAEQATKEDVRTVHRRIDTALARLAVGNPELRAVPPLNIKTPPELDAHNAGEWSRMCAELDVSGEVVVDMGATTLCDSSGIGAIVHLAQRTEVAGGTFTVINVGKIVARSIKILRLGGVLGIEP